MSFPIYCPLYEGLSAQKFRQSDREYFLIGMMKVNFLKRLESSIHSYAITMDRTISKIEKLEKRIERFQQFRSENPEFDFDDLKIEELDDEELQEALQVGEKLSFKMAHLDVETWLRDLKRDKEQLYLLYLSAKDISEERDAKLAELKNLIARKFITPTINKQKNQPNRKVLVFTAFADTAVYLHNALLDWATRELHIHIALVTGGAPLKIKPLLGKMNSTTS